MKNKLNSKKLEIEVCENCGCKWPEWKFFTPSGRIAILCERCLSTEAPIRYPNSREEEGYLLINVCEV